MWAIFCMLQIVIMWKYMHWPTAFSQLLSSHIFGRGWSMHRFDSSFTLNFAIEAGNAANFPYIINFLNIINMLGPKLFSHLISPYISRRGWLMYEFDSRFLLLNLWYEAGNMANFLYIAYCHSVKAYARTYNTHILFSHISGRAWLMHRFGSRFPLPSLWIEAGNVAKFPVSCICHNVQEIHGLTTSCIYSCLTVLEEADQYASLTVGFSAISVNWCRNVVNFLYAILCLNVRVVYMCGGGWVSQGLRVGFTAKSANRSRKRQQFPGICELSEYLLLQTLVVMTLCVRYLKFMCCPQLFEVHPCNSHFYLLSQVLQWRWSLSCTRSATMANSSMLLVLTLNLVTGSQVRPCLWIGLKVMCGPLKWWVATVTVLRFMYCLCPGHWKLNNNITSQSFKRPKSPLILELELRASLCNFWEFDTWSWHAHPKLKLLRSWSILKLLIVRASVKWPCSNWDVKGKLILNKGAFMTGERILESPLACGPQIESLSSWHALACEFDQALVIAVSHGIDEGAI